MGRVTRVTLPDSTSITNTYFNTGEVSTNFGARTYPVAYTYDYAGRQKTMTTWTDSAKRQGAAVTTWNYDTSRGFLTNKTYEGGLGTKYTYTAAGRLQTRTWARGTNTTYTMNAAGDVASLDYSDATPDVTNTCDRRGRLTGVTTGTNVMATIYNDAGQILSETINGLVVSNTYNSFLLRTNLQFLISNSPQLTNSYSYDSAGRLEKVSDLGHSATYAYHANSLLVNTITFRQGTTTRMTTTKSWDNLNRLTQISSAPSADSALGFAYAYNSANQRTAVTNADSSRLSYTYDFLGQVTAAIRYWSDGIPVSGQQFAYLHDDIGNRISYSRNNLNQYSQRQVPNQVAVIGTATNAATVTVNDQQTSRRGDYFHTALGVDNLSSPLWQSITNLAVLHNGTNADTITNITGSIFLPQTPEAFAYDADGNLTNDGRWAYTWDGENRLLRLTAHPSVPSAARLSLNFAYDSRGRRSSKVVSNWTGAAWALLSNAKFVFDGWNLLAELNTTNTAIIQSFIWGADLSGPTQEAGGVGGLIAANFGSGGVHFAVYDGNGNVAGLVNANSGSFSGAYEYSPFGEVLRVEGMAAKGNPFRFSTKFSDTETDLSYYGYRYYNPTVARWLSRDPLEEAGGLNLYAFVANNAISAVDYLGLDQFKVVVEKASQLESAIQNLKRGTSDDFKLPFMKAQLCILKKLAQGECCNSEEGARWLNDIIGKFMNNFLDALNGNYYPENILWKPVLNDPSAPVPYTTVGAVPEAQVGGIGLANWSKTMRVTKKMALTHIQQDLEQALKNHGVGSDVDWACIGNAVGDCQRSVFNWFEHTLPRLILPDEYYHIPTIRDNMRNALKPPFVPQITVNQNRPPSVTTAVWYLQDRD